MLRALRSASSICNRVNDVMSGPVYQTSWRGISFTSAQCVKQMPSRPPPISDEDITEAFLKGSGPGGQKINKTASAVQLKHISSGLVVKVQATRSRSQNRKIARQMLAERIELIEKGDESRVAVVAEAKKKKKSSAVKKSKRKYRLLDAEKSDSTVDGNAATKPEIDSISSKNEGHARGPE